jgi:hypothetical protein
MRRWRLFSFAGTGLKLASRAISRAMVTDDRVVRPNDWPERGKPIHSVCFLGGKANALRRHVAVTNCR